MSVFVFVFVYLQALDKIRFLALTDKDVLGEGDTAKLEIQVSTTLGFERSLSSLTT